MVTIFYWVVNLIYTLFRVQTLGVKGIIFSHDKKLLLVKHTYRPGWHLPGGRVNAFESVKKAVVREVLEEAGVYVEEETLVLTGIHENFGGKRNDHVVIFSGVASGKQEGFKLPNLEILEANFFSMDALPHDVSESTKRRLATMYTVSIDPW